MIIDTRFSDLLEKYRQMDAVELNPLKCVIVGPPQVGKTFTKLNLLRDTESMQKRQKYSQSTGLEAPTEITYIDNDAAVVRTHDSTWTELSSDDLEELLIHCIENQGGDIADRKPSEVTTLQPLSVKESLPTHPTQVSRTQLESTTFDTADAFLKRVYEKMHTSKEELIESITQHSTTVYLTDTGGQPEFHDILPLLLQGPALYVMVFNLAESLDGPYTIKCNCAHGNREVVSYESGHSIANTLGTMLNSFTYFSAQNEVEHVIPRLFVIGTHRDKVSQLDVDSIHERLREVFQLQCGSPQYEMLFDATQKFGTFFSAIDNTTPDGGIQKFRDLLTEAVKSSKPVSVPLTWLIFHLALKKEYEEKKVCTLEDAIKLATGCGINRKDVQDILTYLHRMLGTILYYQDVPALNHIVICHPEAIYRCVSDLIFAFYQKFPRDDVRYDGLIPDREFKKLIPATYDLLNVDYIVKFLEHFRIISPVPDYREVFMPCLLQSLPITDETDNSDIDRHPLIICFPFTMEGRRQECRVIPIGVATALVVDLHSLPSTTFDGKTVQQPWKYSRVRQYKNRYQFTVYNTFTAILVVKPKYLELNVEASNLKGAKRCNLRFQLKQDLVKAVIRVCRLCGYKLEPKVRFYCHNKTPLHLAEYNQNSEQMECFECRCKKSTYPIPSVQRQWLCELPVDVSTCS